jgi:hypothetical protein
MRSWPRFAGRGYRLSELGGVDGREADELVFNLLEQIQQPGSFDQSAFDQLKNPLFGGGRSHACWVDCACEFLGRQSALSHPGAKHGLPTRR